MSMGEVALEVRDYADILVGAEGMEPAFGWPYRRLIAKAKERARGRKGHPTPENLAREIVEEYVTHYHDFDRTAGRSADLAAIDLRKLDDVVTSFKALVTKTQRARKERATTSCCLRTGTRRPTSSTNTLISRTCV